MVTVMVMRAINMYRLLQIRQCLGEGKEGDDEICRPGGLPRQHSRCCAKWMLGKATMFLHLFRSFEDRPGSRLHNADITCDAFHIVGKILSLLNVGVPPQIHFFHFT